ncbi:MAG: dihydrolipoyl dehydrogenase [Desulfobacterales bacterium]
MNRKITVLGAGPGGYVAAVRAAQLGAEVTVVENDRPGGTCLNWGCIPSKILKTTADLMDKMGRAKEFGITLSGEARIDVAALNARKKRIIDAQVKGIETLLHRHRVRLIRGTGRITGPGRAEVSAAGGGSEKLYWDRLLIATGSRPAQLAGLPADGRQIVSSNEALYLDRIPKRVVIVGGGVIGCEFAFIFSSLGSTVTVVEALDRALPLPSVDDSCSKLIQREMKKRKIRFLADRIVKSAAVEPGRVKVAVGPSPFSKKPGNETGPGEEIETGLVLVCVGRAPNSDAIGLETVGVSTDPRGWIPADESMDTGVSGIYAIGDVLGPEKVMLAHVASTEGIVAAENMMGSRRKMRYDVVPSATFTMPEVANVGLTESQAKAAGLSARADSVLVRNIGKAQVIGELAGEAKLVTEVGTGRILGVHMTGPHATDLIAEATLALQMGATAADLAHTIHAHPTLAEILLEAAHKALDQGIHG